MKVRKVEGSEATEVSTPRRRQYTTKLVHPSYIIEPCPNCEFPEADGGYCPDCGWTRGCGCSFCRKNR